MSKKIAQLNEEIIKAQIRELVRGSVEETLNERLNREIRRRTRVVGTFPDGELPPLRLVCARLRHVAGTQWGCKNT